MKILLYSTNYYPEMTGIAKYNTEMAEWLVSKGHKVDVITAMPSYPEWEVYKEYKGKMYITEVKNGVRIYRSNLYVPDKNHTSGLRRLLMQGTFTLNSIRFWAPLFLKKKKYDLMISLCPPLIPQVNAILYSWLKKTPILLHVQDLEFDAAIRLGIIKQKNLLKLLNSIEVFFFNKAKAVSSITYSMIDRIKEKKIKTKRFLFFPNWSDINFITPKSKNNVFRELFTDNKNEIIIMYSGNMGKKQGLEMVTEVAADFKRNNISNIKFIFVGDGVAKELLIERKQALQLDNVQFYPIQPLEKLPELLASADIHLVIQKREAADLVMPSKLTNILSAGRTVIATADQGTALHEVVNSSQSGLAIEPENKNALYDAIIELTNKDSLHSFEQNARKYAEEYLDKDTILKKFEQDLIKLIKEESN